MKGTLAPLLILLLTASLVACASKPVADQTLADNPEVKALRDADQAARHAESIDWDTVLVEDRARRERMLEIIRSQGLQTANDYQAAALIFQHGHTLDDARIAFSLATLA